MKYVADAFGVIRCHLTVRGANIFQSHAGALVTQLLVTRKQKCENALHTTPRGHRRRHAFAHRWEVFIFILSLLFLYFEFLLRLALRVFSSQRRPRSRGS